MSLHEPHRWRILFSDESDGAGNMALDEAISESVAAGLSPPTLRLYTWNPPTISFGCSQHIESEIDVDACQRDGIGLARRISGGRAVLHSQELTYSVFAKPNDHRAFSGSINDTYEAISRGLVKGLLRSGVDAELYRGEVGAQILAQTSAPCFASTSRSEVVLQGRKLVGSAQRRTADVVLQHGSILLGRDHLRIIDYMRVTESVRLRLKLYMEDNTISLQQTDWDEARSKKLPERLRQGFAEVFEIDLEWDSQSDSERDRAISLVSTRYGLKSWTLKTHGSPKVAAGV